MGMRMGRIRPLLLIVLCLFLCLASVSAHSGRTDANGGHRDSSTGEYHYHHGYSAHQYPNGVCPYASTGSGSSSSSESTDSSDGSLNRYVQAAITGVPVEDQGKSFRERAEEYLMRDTVYKTTKTKLKLANEEIDKLSIEVAELKSKNTLLENKNNTLQEEMDLFKDKYLSIGLAVGISLVMGSIILIARNASLKRQLAFFRNQSNESNNN